MKVANIMSSKVLGGVEQAFLNYNQALSNENNKVFAFYNKFGKIKNYLTQDENIEYFPSPFFRPYFLMFPYFFFKIKSLRPDLIIVHSKKVLALFSKIGRILGIPVVIVAHNQKIKTINKADYIFSVTQYQKDIFIKNGFSENKIFVIPNFINFKKEFENFNNPKDFLIFGVIGRFEPIKDFPTFINACKILKNKNIKFKAVIGGAPQNQYKGEYKKIVKLIESNDLKNEIELLGWIDNKDVFYKNIDIFVLPSIHESFGIVLLEAMMYSKPIISSLAEGPKEIFSNTKSALMFDIGDEEQLASLMKELIINQNLAQEIAEHGYKLVNEKYTLEKVAKTLYEDIKNILP